jgi:hypothetical protein
LIRVHAQRVSPYLFAPMILTIAITVALVGGCGGGSTASSDPSLSPTPVTPITVTVSPATASVQTGQTQAFTATVANDSASKGVTWTLSGAGCNASTCGALSAASSASGTAVTYTAPASVPNPAMVTLTATSVADGSKNGTATIIVTGASAAVSVTLSQTTANVQVGATQAFTATVANDAAGKGVTWSLAGAVCTGAACGTVTPTSSASGAAVTYMAPASIPATPTVTLTATSVTDPTKTAATTITITAVVTGQISVTVTPKRGGLTLGQALNLSATVAHDVGTSGVTWTASTGTFSVQSTTAATYVAPASPGSITVTATSIADVTKSASATIGVTDLAGMTTYHNDLSRDGVNAQEYALNTTNVTTSTFGKLFSCAADGAIYAQPLWIANVTVGGAVHNVIVAATAHDSVYVFDADANPCVTYWHANLLDSAHGGTTGETPVPSGITGSLVGLGEGDITPETGVIGTPVIDPATGTIYVVSKSVIASGPTFFQRIHALDLTTGAEKFSGPVVISASVSGTGAGASGGNVTFNAGTENQRPGLALVNGVVWVSWASHEDADPYHGWIIGYNAATLAQISPPYNDTPNGDRGGIWMSGGAPAADSANNLYVITGNGTYDGTTAFGDSFLKFSASATSGLTVTDWFTPADQATLEANDSDFGAGGAAILVDQTSGPLMHLAIGGGKEGNLFLVNRDNMGKNNATNQVVQTVAFGNPIFATPAFWQNNLYLAGIGKLQQFTFSPATGMFNGAAASVSSNAFEFPGATPSVSAQGATNGIVWTTDSSAYGASANNMHQTRAAGPAVLHAYPATSLTTELWDSSQAAGGRDTAGDAVKFTVPTVANGKVYVGTRGNDDTQGHGTIFGEIDVYGLLPN